jgi:hypothetical protein
MGDVGPCAQLLGVLGEEELLQGESPTILFNCMHFFKKIITIYNKHERHW